MSIVDKYSNLKCKSIKDIVLEIVEQIANQCNGELEIVCGWWETDNIPKAGSNVFDFMAGECYHDEINKVMREQGFRVYENRVGLKSRPRTTYRLE